MYASQIDEGDEGCNADDGTLSGVYDPSHDVPNLRISYLNNGTENYSSNQKGGRFDSHEDEDHDEVKNDHDSQERKQKSHSSSSSQEGEDEGSSTNSSKSKEEFKQLNENIEVLRRVTLSHLKLLTAL